MEERILESINEWITSNQEDETKYWQIKLLECLSNYARGINNAKPIDSIISKIHYTGSKSDFQQLVIVPLKNQDRFFVGSSNKGIYLVISENDAKNAVEFYKTRISAEQTHLDNLINVMNGYGVEID